jgi:excinuclease UvrABC nuclease subunit
VRPIKRLTFEIITLEWEKAAQVSDLPDRSGIYQVYGDSPVYGPSSLLYIGQADNLKTRLKSHLGGGALSFQNNTTVRYAACDEPELTTAESILIATHKPSMNSAYINAPSQTTRLVMIQNHGERGVLTLQVTNSHWVEDT